MSVYADDIKDIHPQARISPSSANNGYYALLFVRTLRFFPPLLGGRKDFSDYILGSELSRCTYALLVSQLFTESTLHLLLASVLFIETVPWQPSLIYHV